MAIKMVIFDLDGTITQPYFDFDIIRQEMGLEKNSGPVLETIEKMPFTQRKKMEKILHAHESQAVTQSQLNPGAKQTLEELRRREIKLGILTRNRKSNAIAVAKKHGLKFEAVVGRNDGPVKPDSFGVVHICKQFGISPAETIVVGDYLFDLLCAKAAGAVSVLLANQSRADEFKEHADFTIKKIDQILQIIDRSNS